MHGVRLLYDTEWSEILSMVTIIAKSFQGERFVSNHQYVCIYI
jgi:stress-induced morphogen